MFFVCFCFCLPWLQVYGLRARRPRSIPAGLGGARSDIKERARGGQPTSLRGRRGCILSWLMAVKSTRRRAQCGPYRGRRRAGGCSWPVKHAAWRSVALQSTRPSSRQPLPSARRSGEGHGWTDGLAGQRLDGSTGGRRPRGA
jgi:hypothetical protein